MSIELRALEFSDTDHITRAFQKIGWNKPSSLYEKYLAEQEQETRTVIVVTVQKEFAGYLTVNWHSQYVPFASSRIPEIQDLNILPQFRNNGLASRLLDEAEIKIRKDHSKSGIGVGLHPGYASAQRLYVKRGNSASLLNQTQKVFTFKYSPVRQFSNSEP